jgi:hypothetical protein
MSNDPGRASQARTTTANTHTVLEYVNFVLSVIQDDVRHVQLRATGALAIAAIFVTQIELSALQALSLWWDLATVAGIALLAVAGVLYFHYSQVLNQARLGIANELFETSSVRDIVTTQWKTPFMSTPSGKRLRWYKWGQRCFAGGALLLFAVVAKLMLSSATWVGSGG